MSLKEDLKSDFLNDFLNDDEFAEAVLYNPNGEWPKTIKAIIERKRTEPEMQDRRSLMTRNYEIMISSDAELGVSAIVLKKDTVKFPIHEGGEAVEWDVVEILDSDTGMWHLRVALK